MLSTSSRSIVHSSEFWNASFSSPESRFWSLSSRRSTTSVAVDNAVVSIDARATTPGVRLECLLDRIDLLRQAGAEVVELGLRLLPVSRPSDRDD
jgi:predicted nuclease with RNAse H fold